MSKCGVDEIMNKIWEKNDPQKNDPQNLFWYIMYTYDSLEYSATYEPGNSFLLHNKLLFPIQICL